MRKSRGTEIILDETTGKLVALALKADYTSEHEWGIKDLTMTLGCDHKQLGIDGRIMTEPQAVIMIHGPKRDYLIFGDYDASNGSKYLDKYDELQKWKDECVLASAWSEHLACIAADTDEGKKILSELYKASREKDIAIWLGGSNNPFGGGGLIIAIASRVDRESKDNMLTVDTSWRDLQAEDARLQMQDKLRKAQKGGYPSISPHWLAEREFLKGTGRTTEHKVIYWLNSSDVYGYFTVEELTEWFNHNTGHIVEELNKNRSERQQRAKSRV